MANYSLSRLERIYLQMQSSFQTIPNSAGTATVAGANACRHIKAPMSNEVALLTRKDKTGSRTATQGIAGRKFGKWSTEMSVAPNGTPSVVPDADPIFQSAFGQAATVNTGSLSIASSTNASPIVMTTTTAHGLTVGAPALGIVSGHLINTAGNGVWVLNVLSTTTFSLIGSAGNGVGGASGSVSKSNVQYSSVDQPLLSFCMYSFRQPSTLSQRAAFGCTTSDMQFNLGQDIALWTSSGECVWVLESDQYSVADTTQQGGLSAFPTEPTTPVTNGGVIAGFTGKVTAGGFTMANVRSGTAKYQTGAAIIKDLFGSYYGDSVEADERNVSVSLSLYDQDSAAQQNIRTLGNSRTPADVTLQVGTNVGSIMVIYCRGVQFAPVALDDGQRRFTAAIPESRAFGSSPTAKDEITIWFA